jgi:hypothetical protein
MRDHDRILRQENAVKAYEGEDFNYARGRAGDGKAVAGFARGAVERNERCNSGSVNALDGREIEGDGLAAHQWRHPVEQHLVMTANQFGEFKRLDCGDGPGGWLVANQVGHQNLL